MPRKLIKLPEVQDRVAESKSEIYRKMDRGAFPLSVTQGPNAVAWFDDEIDEYIETRPRRFGPDVESQPPKKDTPTAKPSLGNAAVPGVRQPVPA